MRVVDPGKAKGSLKWLRDAVNQRTDLLNKKLVSVFGFDPADSIEWVSPLEEDEYAEYRDSDFLSRLGIELTRRPLDSFWPTRGPQWDGLARTSNGSVLLLEAKANIPEVISSGTAAKGDSLRVIEKSINETKTFLRVDERITWTGKLYQYTNRLAHLYLLRELNGINAYLVFLYFTGARDVNGPKTEAEWKAALSVVKGVLGIGSRHPLARYVKEVFLEVPDIGHAG